MKNRLENAIAATGFPYAHYSFVNAPDSTYLVYGEDDANQLRAGGHLIESIPHGTIDLFTRDDSGAPKATVETELNKIDGFAFAFKGVEFETDSAKLHYQWAWSLL